MADENENKYTSMQTNMGILPPMFSAKHPGEMSAQLSAQANFQTQQLMQMGMQSRMFSPTTASNPYMQIGTAPLMPLHGAVPNVLGGMGPSSGMFSPGSMPVGASPYTPFSQGPSPAYTGQHASFLPFPLASRLASPQFNTPFASQYQRDINYDESQAAFRIGAGSMGARAGADLMGAGVGAYFGSKFGGRGALYGGMAGFAAAEFGGVGGFAQNAWMNTVGASQTAMAGRTAGLMETSKNFIGFGANASDMGSGFSHHAAMRSAQQLTHLGGSESFQRETGGRFNTQDVFRITQLGSQQGLMSGVGSPEELTNRVRDVSKSLKLVMELANEPDVRQAIQTMGSLRGMGLNFSQTVDAVSQGRSFARAAGTTFSSLAATAGAMGSQTYQSMGLGQGQGLMAGMHAVSGAHASINQGLINPQLAGLVGGAQGLGAMNTAFGAQHMQSPVWAAMMGRNGAMDPRNMQNMMSGRTNMFDAASLAAGNMGGIAGRMGVEGLGMTLGMQGYAQTSMMSAMSPEQRRFMEDRSVMGLSRTMGYRGGAGFMTAAQIMGMSGEQAQARLSELSDPRYYDRLRGQAHVDTQENMGMEAERRRQRRPGFFDTLAHSSETVGAVRNTFRDVSAAWNEFSPFSHHAISEYSPNSAQEAREQERYRGTRGYQSSLESIRRSSVGGGPSMNQYMLAAQAGAGLEGEMAGVTALGLGIAGGSGRAAVQREMIAARESANISTDILTTNRNQESRSARRLEKVFGQGGLSGFGQDVARGINSTSGALGMGQNTGNIISGLTSAALSYGTNGLGNIGAQTGVRTNQIAETTKRSFMSRMTQQGRSPQEAERLWQENKNDLIAGNASTIRLFTDDFGENALNQSAGRGVRANDVNNIREEADRLLKVSYGAALGTSSLGENDERIEGMRDIRRAFSSMGVGDTDEQRNKSRRLMESMTAARLTLLDATDPKEKEAAQKRLNDLNAIAERDFKDKAGNIRDIVTRQSDDLRHGPNAVRAQRAASALTRTAQTAEIQMQHAERTAQDETLRSDSVAQEQGFSRTQRLSSEIRGTMGGARNLQEMLQSVGTMDESKLKEMKESGNASERAYAEAALKAKGGDQSALLSFFQKQGKPVEEARTRFNEQYSGVGGAAKRFMNTLNRITTGGLLSTGPGVTDTFESMQEEGAGGAAEKAGLERNANITGMQGDAASQGLMSATDNFNRVVERFDEAVKEMKEMNSGQHMNNLLNPGTTP